MDKDLQIEELKDVNNIFYKILTHVVVGLVFVLIFNYFFVPRIVERRARDLGLMQYSADEDCFVGKDSMMINKYTIYYFKYGKMTK